MSATVLRELVAKIGFQLDESGFKQAEADIDAIKASLDQLDKSTGQSAARMSRAGKQMAGASSSAASGARGAARAVERASAAVPDRAAARAERASSRQRDARGRFIGKGKGKDSGDSGGGALGAFGKMLGGLAIAATIHEVLELASSANETQNVLQEVFGQKGKAEINAWADAAGKSMGRSTYTLRANAAALGAMIDPMVGNTAKAQQMSQKFAELAVDLGSFFNASDDEALAALKSGISGEAEPLKKFGVVMNEATLAEYAHAQGINKKLSAMTNAEKTELRYGFIVAKTIKASGDAARTQDGFANASKALKDRLKDVGTNLGQKLLPAAGKLIAVGAKLLGFFDELAGKSNIVEATLLVVAAAFGILESEAIAAAIASAAAWAPLILAIAGIALLVDDVYQLFTGGESVIGDWLDTVFGIGTATTVVQGFRDALQIVTETWSAFSASVSETMALLPSLQGMWDLLTGSAMNFGTSAAEAVQRVFDLIVGLGEKVANLGRGFARLLGFDVKDQQGDATGRATGRGLGSNVMSLADARAAREAELADRVRSEDKQRADAAAEVAGRSYASGRGVAAERAAFGVAQLPPPTVSAPVPGAAAAAASSNATTVNNGPVTVNIAAGVGANDAARGAAKAIAAERRRTADAITRSGT